jgi:hypothetical protein
MDGCGKSDQWTRIGSQDGPRTYSYQYSRAYILSPELERGQFIPMETSRTLPVGSPTYCSGTEYTETIMPTVGKDMIDYLQSVTWGHKNQPWEMFDPDLESSPEPGDEDEDEGTGRRGQRLRPAVVNRISYGMGSEAMHASFFENGNGAGSSSGRPAES